VSINWDALLLAYLHDPPDKALSIRGHVPRARDNAKIGVGDHVSKSVLEDAVSSADPLASIIERFPMPTAGDQGQRAVRPKEGQLQIAHPLSAAPRSLPVPELNEQLAQNEKDQLREVIADLPSEGQEQARNRLLAIWRLWPDALAANVNECLALLPADTRTPDHTIWNHLDITAAYNAALSGEGGPALLSFALGPVQRFIEAARSVRDLWSGSMILSWLAFRAMLPVIEQLGPTALVYPALRGIPLVDLWLRQRELLGESKVPLPGVERRMTPSLPHRFLALVPWGANGEQAHALAATCRRAAMQAVKDLAVFCLSRIWKNAPCGLA
jgi:CRISPR-associated protein Cmr2